MRRVAMLAAAGALWVAPAAQGSLQAPRLPDPMPLIIDAPCPYVDYGAGACYYPHYPTPEGGPVVFAAAGLGKFERLYEIGHAWEVQRVDPGERNRIARVLDLRGPWKQDITQWSESGQTRVAMAYATCLTSMLPSHRSWQWPPEWSPRTDRKQRSMCALLYRAGLDLA